MRPMNKHRCAFPYFRRHQSNGYQIPPVINQDILPLTAKVLPIPIALLLQKNRFYPHFLPSVHKHRTYAVLLRPVPFFVKTHSHTSAVNSHVQPRLTYDKHLPAPVYHQGKQPMRFHNLSALQKRHIL